MGLRADIYRHGRGRFANGGISDTLDAVTIVDIDGPSEPSDDAPAVRLVRRVIGGQAYVHAEPVEPVGEGRIGYMAGGTVIRSLDARFRRALVKLGHPAEAVSLHDRSETPEEYRILST